MGFLQPVWKTTNSDKVPIAITYVNGVGSMDQLIRIVRGATLNAVVQAAEERILDVMDPSDLVMSRTLLKEVRQGGFVDSFMDRLDDNVLQSLYLDDAPYSECAISHVRDQQFLVDVFVQKKGRYWTLACKSIRDDGFLLKVLNDSQVYDPVRELAISAVRDPDIIFDIACNEQNDHVRRIAVDRIDDPERMAVVKDCAFKRAQSLSGDGVVPLRKYCFHEYKRYVELFCSLYGKEKLVFVNPINGERLVYTEENPCGEYGLDAYFSNGVFVYSVRTGSHDFDLAYPNATVALTDEAVGDDEIFICPKCYCVREGSTRILKKCTCRSTLNPVRMKYEYIPGEL